MTYEEAIKWLKEHHCPDDWECDCKDTEAMRLAIEALEKQIPKKPKVVEHPQSLQIYFCPQCGVRLLSKINEVIYDARRVEHCIDCGQAIDWEDTE